MSHSIEILKQGIDFEKKIDYVTQQFTCCCFIGIIFLFWVFFSGNIDPVADAGPGDNAYDTVGPVGTSSVESKPPEKNTLPPVYAAVDKNNRQGNTVS